MLENLSKKSADLKQELCELYEFEINSAYQEDEDDDASSIDEESFGFYETNHLKIHSKITNNNNNIKSSNLLQVNEIQINNSHSNSNSNSSHSSVDNHPNINKKGYLSKKNGVRNKWTDRYFVVEGGNELRWFDNEENFMKSPKKPKGKIDLQKARIHFGSQPSSQEASPNLNYPNSTSSSLNTNSTTDQQTKLFIQSAGKNLILDAKNEDELNQWLNVLKIDE